MTNWHRIWKNIRECKFHCPTLFRPGNFGPGPCCHQSDFFTSHLTRLLKLESKDKQVAAPKEEKRYHHHGSMYGILLESIQHFIKKIHGEQKWTQILDLANLHNQVFSTHKVYKDEIMLRLAKCCSEVLQDGSNEDYMGYFGKYFVDFTCSFGYDKMLRVAGRHYQDFLKGIDNIHETIRFSYPKLKSPSFIVESEDKNGCVLTYRSKRAGFKHYVSGQLKHCAKSYYDCDVDIVVLKEIKMEKGSIVTYRLNFENTAYTPPPSSALPNTEMFASLPSSTFFKVFPFAIAFKENFTIIDAGVNIQKLLDRDLIGQKLSNVFKLRRPIIEFSWENILCLQKVIHELEALKHDRNMCNSGGNCKQCEQLRNRKNLWFKKLLFRGQMKFILEWDAVIFICNPLLENLEDIQNRGLYINDLNMFDNSRDMVIAGWQHASQLEYSIDQQIEKSEQIEENMRHLDEWKKNSNALLYSMIPESIAVRLKNGEDPIKTCESFEKVTILFSYLVGFTDICYHATAMQVVECINEVFTLFDNITDRYNVFKVETLGDAVYMVAGGVPDRCPDHAINVAGLGLELIKQAQSLKNPVTGKDLEVRLGMHTGGVVAGVVGKRMPQYCLFGDTVNTASRMQSYSEVARIHISETCNDCLAGSEFITLYRGKVNIKGKGVMKTYWLVGSKFDKKCEQRLQEIKSERLQILQKYRRSKADALSKQVPFIEEPEIINKKSFENGYDFHGMHTSSSFTFMKFSNSSEQIIDESESPGANPPSGCPFSIPSITINQEPSCDNGILDEGAKVKTVVRAPIEYAEETEI